MQHETNGQELRSTRRTFLKSTGALAAGFSIVISSPFTVLGKVKPRCQFSEVA